MCPSAKGNGVWPFNDAWLRTSLSEARRQTPRNGASILDAARELGIRDAQGRRLFVLVGRQHFSGNCEPCHVNADRCDSCGGSREVRATPPYPQRVFMQQRPVAPLRCELSRCRRSPGPTGPHGSRVARVHGQPPNVHYDLANAVEKSGEEPRLGVETLGRVHFGPSRFWTRLVTRCGPTSRGIYRRLPPSVIRRSQPPWPSCAATSSPTARAMVPAPAHGRSLLHRGQRRTRRRRPLTCRIHLQ